MPDLLKDFCDQYIYNLVQTVNIDDDGNEDTQAKVVGKIQGEDSAASLPATVSRLRAINATQLADDEKYGVTTVSRKDAVKRKKNPQKEFQLDAELSKFLYTEDDSYSNNSEEEDVDENDKINSVENNDIDVMAEVGDVKMPSFSDIETDEDSESDNSDDEYSENEGIEKNCEKSVVATDSEDDVDIDVEETEKHPNKRQKIDEKESIENMKNEESKIRNHNTDHKMRGSCVRNQLAIYNTIFDMMVILQKVNTLSNQLPQHEKFQPFLEENNEAYISALRVCRKTDNYFVGQLVDVQESLLKQFPGAQDIVQNETEENCGVNSNVEENDEEAKKQIKKRKFEDLSNILTGRHNKFKSFRENTLTYCHDKVKQIFNQKNFNNFDISIIQQYQNALSNRENLIKRTRQIAATRDKSYRILGKEKSKVEGPLGQQYDSEIYDDSDFYSRLLDEVLKTRCSPMDNTGELTRDFMSIKKSRKNNKYAEKKKSKHRSINFEVRSKAQQFIGPMRMYTGDHAAIDILHKTMFGGQSNY